MPFSAPLLEAEQKQAGTPWPGTNKALLSLGRGEDLMGGREAGGLEFPQRGQKQADFTDPCCHPLGWRSRSVTAFHKTPAPPRFGDRKQELES